MSSSNINITIIYNPAAIAKLEKMLFYPKLWNAKILKGSIRLYEPKL